MWLWNMTPENLMFQLEHFEASGGTWGWNGDSSQCAIDCPVGRAFARLYHAAYDYFFALQKKSDFLYTVMTSNMVPDE